MRGGLGTTYLQFNWILSKPPNSIAFTPKPQWSLFQLLLCKARHNEQIGLLSLWKQAIQIPNKKNPQNTVLLHILHDFQSITRMHSQFPLRKPNFPLRTLQAPNMYDATKNLLMSGQLYLMSGLESDLKSQISHSNATEATLWVEKSTHYSLWSLSAGARFCHKMQGLLLANTKRYLEKTERPSKFPDLPQIVPPTANFALQSTPLRCIWLPKSLLRSALLHSPVAFHSLCSTCFAPLYPLRPALTNAAPL